MRKVAVIQNDTKIFAVQDAHKNTVKHYIRTYAELKQLEGVPADKIKCGAALVDVLTSKQFGDMVKSMTALRNTAKRLKRPPKGKANEHVPIIQPEAEG